jgi:hypothetical protein
MFLSAAASLLIAGVLLTGADVERFEAAQTSAAEPPHKDPPRPAGTASIAGIVATTNDYRVAAVSGIDELVARWREWLDRVGKAATPLSLAARAARTLDLTAADAPSMPSAAAR